MVTDHVRVNSHYRTVSTLKLAQPCSRRQVAVKQLMVHSLYKPEPREKLDCHFDRIVFRKIGCNFSLVYSSCLKACKSVDNRFSAVLRVNYQDEFREKHATEVSSVFSLFVLILFCPFSSDFIILELFTCYYVILFISD